MIPIQSDFSFFIRAERFLLSTRFRLSIPALYAPISMLSFEACLRISNSALRVLGVTTLPSPNISKMTFMQNLAVSWPPKFKLALSDFGCKSAGFLRIEIVSRWLFHLDMKAPVVTCNHAGADSLCITGLPKSSVFAGGSDIETAMATRVFGSTGTFGVAFS